eukprot:2485992-Pyramimonas_sp.AAC.1
MGFMVWMTEWLTGMRNAARWRPCHSEECKTGDCPKCPMSGRTLTIIVDIREWFVVQAIADMGQLTENTSGGDQDFLRQLQGSVRWARGLILDVT